MPEFQPPPLLAFVSQTGNVMKTTLAAATAIELAKIGADIAVLDLDREHRQLGSLATWAADRASFQPHRQQLSVLTADSTKEAIQHIHDATMKRVVILDCPSRASDATAAIAAMSTLTVFPLVPGKKDSYLTLATMHKLIEGDEKREIAPVPPEQLAIVLTRCQTQAEIRELADWIKANSPYSSRFGLILPALLEKPAYRIAIAKGLAITEVAPIQMRQTARAVVHAIIARFSALEDQDNAHKDAAA